MVEVEVDEGANVETNDPGTTNSGSIGRITGTTPQNGANPNDPRIAQLSLKLMF